MVNPRIGDGLDIPAVDYERWELISLVELGGFETLVQMLPGNRPGFSRGRIAQYITAPERYKALVPEPQVGWRSLLPRWLNAQSTIPTTIRSNNPVSSKKQPRPLDDRTHHSSDDGWGDEEDNGDEEMYSDGEGIIPGDDDPSYFNPYPKSGMEYGEGTGGTRTRGKRGVGFLKEDSGDQNSPVSGSQNSGEEDGESDRPDRGGGGGGEAPNLGSMGSRGRPFYACPFFKNDPEKYVDCAKWKATDIRIVKYGMFRFREKHPYGYISVLICVDCREHCKTRHLKPLQCPRCGRFRAGDQGQIRAHIRDGDCERVIDIVPVEDDVVAKGEALLSRSLSWEQIYGILFPGYDIPDPDPRDQIDWEDHAEDIQVPGFDVNPPLQAYAGVDEGGGFVSYRPDKFSRLAEHLGGLSHKQLPASVSNESTTYEHTHSTIHHSVSSWATSWSARGIIPALNFGTEVLPHQTNSWDTLYGRADHERRLLMYLLHLYKRNRTTSHEPAPENDYQGFSWPRVETPGVWFVGSEGKLHDTASIHPLLLQKSSSTIQLGEEDNERRKVISKAISRGRKDVIELLLKGSSSRILWNEDNQGRTVLHEATSRGQEDIIELLLKNVPGHFNISSRDNKGRTALHEAAAGGHVDAVRLLLEKGIEVSCEDNQGRTALQEAAFKALNLVIQLVLKSGAGAKCKDNDEQTVLDIATFHRCMHEAVAQLLRENKAHTVASPLPFLRDSDPTTESNTISGNSSPRILSPRTNDTMERGSNEVNRIGEGGDGGGDDDNGEMGSDSDSGNSYWNQSPHSLYLSYEADFRGRGGDKVSWGGKASGGDKARGKQKEKTSLKRPAQQISSAGNSSQEDESSNPASKRQKGDEEDHISGSSPSKPRPFACPYFKNNALKHLECAEWHAFKLKQVKYESACPEGLSYTIVLTRATG